MALVIALPVLAWGLSRMIVHGGLAGLRWMHRKQYERWHGMYYEFATVQLRAAEHDDGSLVFVESDLLTVIEQPDSITVKLFGPALGCSVKIASNVPDVPVTFTVENGTIEDFLRELTDKARASVPSIRSTPPYMFPE